MYGQKDEEDPNQIIYYLPLDNSGRPKLGKDQILQTERNSILRIELMNGLEITNQINLVTNAQENFPYELQERLLIQDNINKEDFSKFIFQPKEVSTSIIYEIKLERTGSIQFFFLYNDPNTDNENSTLPFYVTVLPKVIIQGKEIKLDDIQLQTILSKSLGKVNEFEKYFEEASRLKYNFVHFTPIQQLGISESLYCLRDNTKINNIFFDSDKLSEDQKYKLFKEQLDKGREIYGIGSLVDIVLNHASDNSEWLSNHPECGYNLENCPWLNCAYYLDCILQEYSNAFCDCKTSRKCQPYVNNENELNEIMGDLWNIVNKANLIEFFMMNFDENKKILNNFYEKFNKDRNKYTHQINSIRISNDKDAMEYIFNNCLDDIGVARNGVKINAKRFGCCLIKLFNYNIYNKNAFFGKAEQFMRQCNDRWKGIIPGWIEGGMNNIRGGMHWEFIQNHNKAVRRIKPLISPYFAVFDKKDKRKIFACNGWVGESEDPKNPAPDFTAYGTHYYFKRKINIWSDCPKLNYGNSPSDCPYLMKHMTKYVQQMAKMFNGFRLDNAHSTPIFVAEYLAQKAREVNPDIIIMAELFTKKEKEINFVNRIGINLLIRELIWCGDARGLSAQLHRYGGGYDHMLGKIEENKFDYIKNDNDITLKNMKYLLPSLPHSIIFDLTHDNETFLQKMNNLALNLTNMACNSFSSTAIGTTRGVDQLFPLQPSVVNEQRKYNYDEQFNNMFPQDNYKPAPKKEKKKEEPKEVPVRFEYRNNRVNKVDLALSCRGWKPDINLKKVGGDLFSTEIILKNNQKILYKFVIDGGKWVCDDSKPKEDDGKGNVNNVISLGSAFQSKSNNSSDNFGNNSQREFHLKDLKLLRRQLNYVRNDISNYKNEFFLHQDNQFLCIFRTFVPEENYLENVPSYDGYALICRTGYDQGGTTPTRIELPGIYSEFVCGSTMGLGKVDIEAFKKRADLYGTDSDVYFTRDGKWLNAFSYINQERGRTIINFKSNMPCNSAVILKYKLTDEVRNALVNIEREINQMNNDWKALTQDIDLCDINLVLYKCEKEEKDNTKGERGTYSFEKFGPLCYAGISHLHKKLDEFKLTKENNTILDNIRTGDWLLDYTIKRYKDQPHLKNIYNILSSILGNYSKLYVHHKPVYITKIIDTLYNIMIMKLYDLMKNKEIVNFSSFSRLLLDAVPQFNGYIESSRFKHNTDYPLNKLSLSAGLPHFSAEYMRCWGRDTFISFKGLFLIPGLYNEARAILINYASVMRHGLIPNLLDCGINCRYNARDATWFFMKSVVDYVEMSKDFQVLNFPINMVFLSDDFNENNEKKTKGEKKSMKLAEIVHEILQRHVKGISFREWRAGKQIDEQMTDEGFNIKIYFNEENGFIYGGNKWNCGTWMDKMGSSEKAKNKGHPATPRNGADCEIIGLLYYTLIHLDSLNKQGIYPFNEVKLNNGGKLKYSEWAKKIRNNFENYFFIDKKNNNAPHDNTYKDYISDDNDLRHEAQLRCNIFITLAVAPELFDKKHAIKFMRIAEQYLVVENCIGIRTLDFTDKNYNGNYDVHNDSDNYLIAHGLNYHNGPEWVWPSGFYLISKMNFNNGTNEVFIDLCRRLIPFEKYIEKDKWSGLPELTNKDGSFCEGSCPTQAWSIATLIEALNELAHRYNNLFGSSTDDDDKKKRKNKRRKYDDDEDKRDNDDENKENEEEETKKKSKKTKKKTKKSRREKEEKEEKNEDKEEPIENEENVLNINKVNEEETNEVVQEKSPKKKKKKSKKKKSEEPKEEIEKEPELEQNEQEKKEEFEPNVEKEAKHIRKKKKKSSKKKKHSHEDDVQDENNIEEPVEKEKKGIRKKKLIKKKKTRNVEEEENPKEEDSNQFDNAHKKDYHKETIFDTYNSEVYEPERANDEGSVVKYKNEHNLGEKQINNLKEKDDEPNFQKNEDKEEVRLSQNEENEEKEENGLPQRLNGDKEELNDEDNDDNNEEQLNIQKIEDKNNSEDNNEEENEENEEKLSDIINKLKEKNLQKDVEPEETVQRAHEKKVNKIERAQIEQEVDLPRLNLNNELNEEKIENNSLENNGKKKLKKMKRKVRIDNEDILKQKDAEEKKHKRKRSKKKKKQEKEKIELPQIQRQVQVLVQEKEPQIDQDQEQDIQQEEQQILNNNEIEDEGREGEKKKKKRKKSRRRHHEEEIENPPEEQNNKKEQIIVNEMISNNSIEIKNKNDEELVSKKKKKKRKKNMEIDYVPKEEEKVEQNIEKNKEKIEKNEEEIEKNEEEIEKNEEEIEKNEEEIEKNEEEIEKNEEENEKDEEEIEKNEEEIEKNEEENEKNEEENEKNEEEIEKNEEEIEKNEEEIEKNEEENINNKEQENIDNKEEVEEDEENNEVNNEENNEENNDEDNNEEKNLYNNVENNEENNDEDNEDDDDDENNEENVENNIQSNIRDIYDISNNLQNNIGNNLNKKTKFENKIENDESEEEIVEIKKEVKKEKPKDLIEEGESLLTIEDKLKAIRDDEEQPQKHDSEKKKIRKKKIKKKRHNKGIDNESGGQISIEQSPQKSEEMNIGQSPQKFNEKVEENNIGESPQISDEKFKKNNIDIDESPQKSDEKVEENNIDDSPQKSDEKTLEKVEIKPNQISPSQENFKFKIKQKNYKKTKQFILPFHHKEKNEEKEEEEEEQEQEQEEHEENEEHEEHEDHEDHEDKEEGDENEEKEEDIVYSNPKYENLSIEEEKKEKSTNEEEAENKEE